MNSLLDTLNPRGACNYWKSSFLAALSDDAIHTLVDCYARCPSPMSQVLLEHLHGAAVRVGASETALAWVRETFAAMPAVHGDRSLRQLSRRRPER
jgi:hypothetical protein